MEIQSPRELRDKMQRLLGTQEKVRALHQEALRDLQELNQHLKQAPEISSTLEHLGKEVFGQTITLLREKLTLALQEVLQQPIKLEVTSRYLRGSAAMEFHIERHGNEEHILKGQGGSVANILSVGLRIFALSALDPESHRRFLVLDEQDCWLHPDLVPRLAKIIHDAGKALGFQILMISHHKREAFEPFADAIYHFEPSPRGVQVSPWVPNLKEP